MKRPLVYKPAAQRELARMDRSDSTRIIHALEAFAADGRGDVKALTWRLPLFSRKLAQVQGVGQVFVGEGSLRPFYSTAI